LRRHEIRTGGCDLDAVEWDTRSGKRQRSAVGRDRTLDGPDRRTRRTRRGSV